MTAETTTIATTPDALTAEIEILAPPDRVFAALTEQPQLFLWWGREPSVELTSFEMDARVGGHWQFTCIPNSKRPADAIAAQLEQNAAQEFIAHGEVLEIDPPRLLIWSWTANWHRDPLLATVVRWELTPTRSGTLVRVTHSGLTNDAAAHKDYNSGWVGVLRLLNGFLSED